MKRRDFVSRIPAVSAGILAGFNNAAFSASSKRNEMNQTDFSVVIPMPVQVVIDDVGWWSGTDGSKQQEPYRTGIQRDHVPADYDSIAYLGRSLGIRPQAAMILCEWDKKNILKKLPHSTWMGKNWDNSRWVGKWLEEAADIIRSNKANYEITLHGIGHEFWDGDTFTRAEWADKNGTMRPSEEVERHLEYYGKLMDQHDLGDFPVSFVPTAFLHGYGITQGNKVSMAEILKKHDLTYINTPFRSMHNAESVSHGIFGFDSGVLTVDRGRDLMSWFATGKNPEGYVKGPTCGMHWANILHTDPSRNREIADAWIKVLSPHRESFDTMLAPDSVFFQKQLVHHTCTRVTPKGNRILFDFNETDSLPLKDHNLFVLNIKGGNNLKFTSDSLKVISQSVIKKDHPDIYSLQIQRTRTGNGELILQNS